MRAVVTMVPVRRVGMISHSAPFDDIAARLSELRVSALPVVDDQHTVTGVVYDTDLLDAEARSSCSSWWTRAGSRSGP